MISMILLAHYLLDGGQKFELFGLCNQVICSSIDPWNAPSRISSCVKEKRLKGVQPHFILREIKET